MRIYFDHNATTPLHPDVARLMFQATMSGWANPSSLHAEGRVARHAVETARQQVAALIGARPEEIVFTSGGTESNNTALLGLCRQAMVQGQGRGPAIDEPRRLRRFAISSPLEHPSVGVPLRVLGEEGLPVTLLPVDQAGRLDPDDLRRALRASASPGGGLVSLALCNHELGNLYPIAELCRLAHEHGALFHCDAVQAAGRVPVDVAALGVDLLSLSAHKLHGPKGVGALYCRAGHVPALAPLLHGGQQEKGRRAGTENGPAIAGFGLACQLARAGEGLAGRAERVGALRDLLQARLLSIPGARLHGDPAPGGRGPGTCNVGFTGVEGDLLMMNLDLLGVAVATGAACSSGSLEPSPVLLALGLSQEAAREGVRFSLSADTTPAEVEQVAAWVAEIVARVRSL